MKKRKGQSTLEYVLILTAIIAAVIVAANGMIKPKVESSMNHVSGVMEEQVQQISFNND